MAKVLYFLLTFLESVLSVFGIRSTQQQPDYRVIAQLTNEVQIRAYGPITVVETSTTQGDNQAFSRLFDYITGANKGDQLIKMTVPVEQSGGTWSDENSPGVTLMRFFLPPKIAADAPAPKDPQVRVVTLPPRIIAAIRFSGSIDRQNLASHFKILRETLAKADRKTDGAPFFLGYDPPFTIPALRRNEVAIDVEP